MLKRFFVLSIFLILLSFLHYPRVFARDVVTAMEVTGTFENREGSTFEILSVGKGKLQVRFYGIHPHRIGKETTTNIGEAVGLASIDADMAVFKPVDAEKSCTITVRFTQPGKIQVTEQGDSSDCGFGNNVRADGSYWKTSSEKPKF